MTPRKLIYCILWYSLQLSAGQILKCRNGQWQCDDGSCVPDFWRCDGDADCLDGSDEMDCIECPPGQVRCVDSASCVDVSVQCSGQSQCPNGSDNCTVTEDCLMSDWTCQNSICIPKELVCNGQNDCLDNSDEENCVLCGNEEIQCPDGRCLSAEERCDGKIHCSDASDEPITCGRICSMNNGGCSHLCVDQPWGVLCGCPDGYTLSNGTVCIDLDECAVPFSSCMHRCINTIGSYYCQCEDGFTLVDRFCQFTGNATKLLMVNGGSIGLLNVKSQELEIIQNLKFEPVALTFDISRGWYYWADNKGSIYRTQGQNIWMIYSGELGIKGLACDWLNGNLFWTNQRTESIYMLADDGISYTSVLSKNIRPSELVLIPVESSMFWINTGPKERVTIEKSWMDGSDRRSLAVLTAQSAHSLTADVAARRLYWISDFKKSIETVKVDGTGRYTFPGQFNRRLAVGLAVFDSTFFWVDDKGLWRAPQTQLSQRKFIWKSILPVFKIYHELQQPQGTSACVKTPCQMCLLTNSKPNGFTCACPKSKVQLFDETCDNPRFLYATVGNINLLEFKEGEYIDKRLLMSDDRILSFDVDFSRDLLYWNNQSGNLKCSSLIHEKIKLVPIPLLIFLIKVDQRSGNLYWVSLDQTSIGTSKADNPYPEQLYKTTQKIQDFYLDWLRGEILWLEKDHILTMSIRGGNVRELLRSTGAVLGTITFDIRANSLLWNSKAGGLMTMSLVQERKHGAGSRWNVSGSVISAYEPFLLSFSNNVMKLWDRRDGGLIESVQVARYVSSAIAALGDIETGSLEQTVTKANMNLAPAMTTPVLPSCISPSVLCPLTTFHICITPNQFCDGHKDCPNGFDEQTCVKSCPSKNDFRCKDSRSCVSQSLVCDGRSHCHDGSDEVNCPTVGSSAAPENSLRCRTGSRLCQDRTECVLLSHVCDGEIDCQDGSDEAGCDAKETSATTVAGAPNLYPSSLTVETIKQPTTPLLCTSPSFLCPDSSLCIKSTQLCDGRRDCPDGSDENCVKRCPIKTDFRCQDRRSCISQSLVCDGRSHCHDGSDEVNCPSMGSPAAPANTLRCRAGSRLCQDGTECVLLSHVCDGEIDCQDGSDEDGCGAEETPTATVAEIPNLYPSPQPVETLNQPPTPSACTSPSFLCPDSSLCIKSTQLCDGRRDCPDGSDENCVKRCPIKTDFRCKDRRSCVSQSLVCDGRSNCHDGSDEVNCPSVSSPVTPTNTLRCRTGSRLCQDGTECVLLSHVCDGEKDCQDGSDEDSCDAGETTTVGEISNYKPSPPPVTTFKQPPAPPLCTSPAVLCPDSSLCIKSTQLCDGRRDCPDGSDENCVKRCSIKTDFRCKDRRSCVSQSLVCDGRSHCHDGSDEVNCPSVSSPLASTNTLRCRTGSRLCQDGTECVLLSHICDGEKYCQDGSDEDDCNAGETTIVGEIPHFKPSPPPVEPSKQPLTLPPCNSPSFLCPDSSLCIKSSQICDGRRDCPDGSDENCVKRCPMKTDFRCKDRRSCVSQSLVCDGRSHCHDGSDEVNCPSMGSPVTPTNILRCRTGSRLCQDGTECVLFSHICDGEKDCQDGSDEDGCKETTIVGEIPHLKSSPPPVEASKQPLTLPSCTSPSFLCPDSSLCIKSAQLCDGRRDCPDGSDENCVKRCPMKTDFRCQDRRSCVSQSLVCDGRSHCHDGSDEVNCPSVRSAAASANTLRCRTGSRLCQDGTECVLFSHICDGERDCQDGSDEDGCNAGETTVVGEIPHLKSSPPPVEPSKQLPTLPPCNSPSFLCPDSSLCIKSSQICDGRRDCPDGSDENCVKRCPMKTDFRCTDRRSCVSQSLVCDGRSHCRDGSDEVNCPSMGSPAAPTNTLRCRTGSRLCQDGTECVLFSHVCDGERDCQDGSDEDGCEMATGSIATLPQSNTPSSPVTPINSPAMKPPCAQPRVMCPDSSSCILVTQLCDGSRDCLDGSDEDCLERCPSANQFMCKDRRSCISLSLVCDGRSHCNDGTDEIGCSTITAAPANILKCRRDSKPCNDGTECVFYSHLCDGERDCPDGSDELGCQETCKQDEFQCAHGKNCIPAAQVCNGKADCRDQSDELNCWEKTRICEHRCSDGKRCIPKKFLCDGEKDCVDGTDEVGCDNVTASAEPPASIRPKQCITPSVLCPGSSICISQKQLCDGKMDCPDAFDESNCIFQCKNPGDFLCSDKRKCIPRVQVCDGFAHCPDNSDERLCKSEDRTAPFSHKFTTSARSTPLHCRTGFKPCKDGLECVMYSHVCDGEIDCADGSDEESCVAQCKAEEFLCSHGNRCILKVQVCDGQYDCQDQSDEINCLSLSEGCDHHCDNNTRCLPKTFLCDSEKDCADGSDEEKCGNMACLMDQFRCTSGQCVSEALKCDGYADCNDRSDEVDCTRPPRCMTQLRCPHSHECLQKEWLCDGEEDCTDGSDEKNCMVTPANCREHQWPCEGSSQCIPQSWRCDGKEDCHNSMDEYKCKKRNCPSHLYQCGSGECVEPRLVCNSLTNCADSSDEGVGCTEHNCSSPSAPRCDNYCVNTPNGLRCYCAAGFTLHPSDMMTCVDIDECRSLQERICKHICVNTLGSFKCHCHPGFYLEPDNKSCKPRDEPLLLASVQSELLVMGVHSGTLRLLSSASRPVFSLDYHWAHQRVYWLSPDYQSIRWTDISKPDSKRTLIKGVKSDFIAVDWVGKNLYWVDGLVGQILAVQLRDTTALSQDYTVVLQDLEQPSSLVLLSHKGFMMWSEIGSTPQIERSGMDGTKRKVVVSSGLSWPVSLTFDILDNRVYWADEKLRCIGSASFDGDNVKILQLAETPSPFSVAVFNNRIFWSDTKRRTVRSADKNSGKDQMVLLKRPGQPFGLKLMHALSQPVTSNPCDQLRCSHLCLVAPGLKSRTADLGSSGAPTAVCRCPKGLLLSKDKMSCSLPVASIFVLLLSRTTVYQIYLNSTHQNGVALKKMPNSRVFDLPGVIEASCLDMAVQRLALYVADRGTGSVTVLKMSEPSQRTGLIPAAQALKLKDDSVTALAVDWVTSNLYWSSTNKPDVHVTSFLNGYTTSLLFGPIRGTVSIALHPPTGQLCYTAVVMAGGKSHTWINCAWMDGRNKAALWKKSSIPTSLVFSNKGTIIYWADKGEDTVSSIGLDGSGYRQYKTGPGLIFFTFIEDMLLWSTIDKDVTKLWFSNGLQPKQLWFETKTSLVEIRAYSNSSQSGTNLCSSNNGGCEHLCLPNPEGRTCRCDQESRSVTATSCAPSSPCPNGEDSCSDKGPDMNMASSQSKDRGDRLPQSSSPHPYPPKDIALPVKEDSALCNPQYCSGHGTCITEDKVTRCQCKAGYKGEHCRERVTGQNHVAVILGVFCLVAALTVAVTVFTKRNRTWIFTRGKSTEKETLMANMGLPCEQDSDCEELESPSDVRNPTIRTLQLK